MASKTWRDLLSEEELTDYEQNPEEYKHDDSDRIGVVPMPTADPADTAETAGTPDTVCPVREWYEKYDKFVWSKIHGALDRRFDVEESPDEADLIRGRKLDLANDLHAAIWLHIVEKWPKYQDRGYKRGPMAWIGTVAANFIRDYFRVEDNRKRLRPTESLGADAGEEGVKTYLHTAEIDLLPARPVRPTGSGPDSDE